MILAFRTNAPDAQVVILNDEGRIIDDCTWAAHRTLARDLLRVTKDRLAAVSADWSDISGIIVFKDPGSFTGLRIGATVANTIAHTNSLPIVGSSGDEWVEDGMAKLKSGANDRLVLPDYGREARITQPKK